MKTFRAKIKITADCDEAWAELTPADVRQWLGEQFDGCDLGEVEIGDVTLELSPEEVGRFVELATAPSAVVDRPREKTAEETRKEFLDYLRALVEYWESETGRETSRGKLEGLAFSFLSTLDGCAVSICGFDLVPRFHPDDPEYLRSQGENWYGAEPINSDVQLHELWHRRPDGASDPT